MVHEQPPGQSDTGLPNVMGCNIKGTREKPHMVSSGCRRETETKAGITQKRCRFLSGGWPCNLTQPAPPARLVGYGQADDALADLGRLRDGARDSGKL